LFVSFESLASEGLSSGRLYIGDLGIWRLPPAFVGFDEGIEDGAPWGGFYFLLQFLFGCCFLVRLHGLLAGPAQPRQDVVSGQGKFLLRRGCLEWLASFGLSLGGVD
jgi:hypothetical protein